MGLSVTFVSGPRRSGKSATIRAMIDHLYKKPPHYVRLVKANSDKTPPKKTSTPPTNCGVASAQWLEYDCERVFEVIPDALAAIYRKDRFGAVLLEADADPTLRCAFPYDHRVFVMPTPTAVTEVFRDPSEAAAEFRRALDDTTMFASEIFGLFNRDSDQDCDPSEERPALTPLQLRTFLQSPLAEELATRIQLQPPYHGLVESDVIVVNTGTGQQSEATVECLNRVSRLLGRLGGVHVQRAELYCCDLRDLSGGDGRRFLKALRPLCNGGK